MTKNLMVVLMAGAASSWSLMAAEVESETDEVKQPEAWSFGLSSGVYSSTDPETDKVVSMDLGLSASTPLSLGGDDYSFSVGGALTQEITHESAGRDTDISNPSFSLSRSYQIAWADSLSTSYNGSLGISSSSQLAEFLFSLGGTVSVAQSFGLWQGGSSLGYNYSHYAYDQTVGGIASVPHRLSLGLSLSRKLGAKYKTGISGSFIRKIDSRDTGSNATSVKYYMQGAFSDKASVVLGLVVSDSTLRTDGVSEGFTFWDPAKSYGLISISYQL